MTTQRDIISYYDNYIGRQTQTGINIRHYHILQNLVKTGLKKNSRVLEVGCGVGTLTQLVAAKTGAGQVLAVDISPKSVETARERLRKYKHVDFLVSDMTDFPTGKVFDCVVLPDVIEHIPFEQHAGLFETLSNALSPEGFVLINIPAPRFQEWLYVNQPEKLQAIDLAVHTDILIDNTRKHFYVESLNQYAIFRKEPDYQTIVLRKHRPMTSAPSLDRYTQKLRYWWHKFLFWTI